jgi:ATP-dependent Clp protease protease subunit
MLNMYTNYGNLRKEVTMSKEVTKEHLLENAQSWITLGVDLQSRRIQLDMDVGDLMASIVIRSLVKMSEISDEPIEIFLSSYGGEAYAGFAIYDAIRACPCDVIIHATGKIMSAATLIYLAGDIRLASKHTTFMIHSVSSGTQGKIKDQEIDVLEGKRINNIMLDILTERTKMKKTWWYRKILSHDMYIDTTLARDYGFIIDTPKQKTTTVTKKAKKVNKKAKPRTRG